MGFQLVHIAVQKVDSLFQCAQERVFFFFHHAGDKLLLSRKFGISLPHFLNQNRQKLIQESFFLIEESIGIAHSTTQNATDDIARLGITRQLSVGN